MGLLYAKDGKIYCNEYTELYVPMSYFETNLAINKGSSIETFAVCYVRSFKDGKEGDIKLFNIPAVTNLMVYEFKNETIHVHGQPLDVLTLQYMKDSYILHQTIPNGREVAEAFLASVLNGKLPITLNYTNTINMWWKNLEISGVSFKVPSKIFEMILAATYRNPNNTKERYGQLYGRQTNPNGFDYATGSVRAVVRDLSTFSGMVFEDTSTMISNAINNSRHNVEEQVSPLEKIIYY